MNLLVSGRPLGRYELLLPLAKGGMAQVWAARLRGTRGIQKIVAVKTILAATMEGTRAEQMLVEEATLAAQIHHPNVVTTLELGTLRLGPTRRSSSSATSSRAHSA